MYCKYHAGSCLIGHRVSIPKIASEPLVTSIESCDGFTIAFVREYAAPTFRMHLEAHNMLAVDDNAL